MKNKIIQTSVVTFVALVIFGSLGSSVVEAKVIPYEPQVKTYGGDVMGSNGAQLGGVLVDTGGQETRVGFEYGVRGNGCSVDRLTESTVHSARVRGGTFHRTVSGLRENTFYCVRAVAENGSGVVFGEMKEFKTYAINTAYSISSQNSLPELGSLTIERTSDDRATVRGFLKEVGGTVTSTWFEYGERQSGSCISNDLYRKTDPKEHTTSGSFTEEIQYLERDIVYCIRAVARNEKGSVVTETETLTTRSGSSGYSSSSYNDRYSNIEIDSYGPTDIRATTVTLRGRVIEEGAGDVKVWFEADSDARSLRDGFPHVISEITRTFSEGDTFQKQVIGLKEGTQYFYRACGIDNSGEEKCSDIRSFVTSRITTASTSGSTYGNTHSGDTYSAPAQTASVVAPFTSSSRATSSNRSQRTSTVDTDTKVVTSTVRTTDNSVLNQNTNDIKLTGTTTSTNTGTPREGHSFGFWLMWIVLAVIAFLLGQFIAKTMKADSGKQPVPMEGKNRFMQYPGVERAYAPNPVAVHSVDASPYAETREDSAPGILPGMTQYTEEAPLVKIPQRPVYRPMPLAI